MSETFAFIIGTRAQLVKMAPVMRAASDAGHRIGVVLTGQHLDSMSELAADLGVMEFFPADELVIERSTVLKLATWLPNAFLSCRKRLKTMAGDGRTLALVHGDTASTLVGAIAARSLGLPVAHIESGLSSGRLADPFPEELIRRFVFRFTTYAVCPNGDACKRMSAHRVDAVIDSAGNTIADALVLALQRSDTDAGRAYDIVASIHRFENIRTQHRLQYIVDELEKISQQHRLAFVLHPATVAKLRSFRLYERLERCSGIYLLPRMSYSRFISLAARARAIITDGGSNQEEFALLGIPTIILRERSERPDGIGENAILEKSLGKSLSDYLLGGTVESLRKPRTSHAAGSISARIVAALERERATLGPEPARS